LCSLPSPSGEREANWKSRSLNPSLARNEKLLESFRRENPVRRVTHPT